MMMLRFVSSLGCVFCTVGDENSNDHTPKGATGEVTGEGSGVGVGEPFSGIKPSVRRRSVWF